MHRLRRIALVAACLAACAALMIFLVPARAAAVTALGPYTGLHKDAVQDNAVQLVHRDVHGGGRVWRGGGRAYAFRGGRRYG